MTWHGATLSHAINHKHANLMLDMGHHLAMQTAQTDGSIRYLRVDDHGKDAVKE